ncbi:AAA family ATPase [Paenibacillus sp. FSL W8-0186]|uniref:AAA family ATPase n=1 Tax=Paenibacillus sp. FSL W8-0186 TaxID=2921709 RepID=UPI0030D405D5
MRLDKLQVSGFGHLSGLELDLQGPVTVLYGPNEAGKSTLLGFVRAMLFGIPSRTYGPMRYEPARGGAHGGQLILSGEEGDRWVIERYAQQGDGRAAGSRGERLRITRTDSEGRLFEAAQEEMQRELLGGLSSDMFKQLFAISLTELQEVAALQSEELSRFLFHAGIGGGAAVLRGEKRLGQEMDKLYRPRGRTQELAQLLQGYERLAQEAEAARKLLPRYNEALAELERIVSELAVCEEEREICSRELAKLSKASLIREDWLARERLRAELQALPEYEGFPEEGFSRWNALQEEKERLLLDQAEMRRKMEAMSAEISRLAPNLALLAKAEAVRALHGQLTGYEARKTEIAELQAEIRMLRQRLEGECLRSIDAHWTEAELASFAGTVGEREAVRQFGARFAAYEKEMELVYSEQHKLAQEAAAAKEAYSAAMSRLEESAEAGRREFAMLVPKRPAEIRQAWSELSRELERWHEDASSRLREMRAKEAEVLAGQRIQGLYRKLLIGSAALTVIVPGVIWLSSRSVWGLIAAFALFAGLDMYLWLGMGRAAHSNRRGGPRRYPGEDDSSRAEARLRTLLDRLVSDPLTAAGRTDGAAAPLHPEEWDRRERELRQLMERWQLWEQRHAALGEEIALLRQRAAAALERCEHAERELAKREAEFGELSREWELWLRERKLSAELSPEAALDVFRLAQQGKEWQNRLEQLAVRSAMLSAANEAYEHEVKVIGSDLDGEPAAQAGLSVADHGSGAFLNSYASEPEAGARAELADLPKASLGRVVIEAMSQLSAAEKIYAQRELLASKLETFSEELERLNDRLGRIGIREQALLKEGNAANGEDFLRRSAEASRRAELEREIRQLETVMFSGFAADQQSRLEALLGSCSKEELQERLLAAEKAAAAKEKTWRELQERRGRLLQEQEALERRGRQEEVSQKLADQQAALRDALDQYAVRAVCQELISRARRVYEEERQPEVLRLASAYLRKMTNGRYERIVLKMGSQELQAEHRDHGAIGSAALSRGTAEQLYLSMRLALAEAVSHQRSIPILLDDLFVNFDAERLQGVIAVLKEIAPKRQMIMMTCHAHVVQGIQAQIPEAQIVNLG